MASDGLILNFFWRPQGRGAEISLGAPAPPPPLEPPLSVSCFRYARCWNISHASDSAIHAVCNCYRIDDLGFSHVSEFTKRNNCDVGRGGRHGRQSTALERCFVHAAAAARQHLTRYGDEVGKSVRGRSVVRWRRPSALPVRDVRPGGSGQFQRRTVAVAVDVVADDARTSRPAS